MQRRNHNTMQFFGREIFLSWLWTGQLITDERICRNYTVGDCFADYRLQPDGMIDNSRL